MTTENDRLEFDLVAAKEYLETGTPIFSVRHFLGGAIKEVEKLRDQLAEARPGWCPVCHERVYNKVRAENAALKEKLAEYERKIIEHNKLMDGTYE